VILFLYFVRHSKTININQRGTLAGMKIIFKDGQSEHEFVGPLATMLMPKLSGIYAVLKLNNSWGPLPYEPLYSGKAAVLADRVTPSHENFLSWKRAARGSQLFYAYKIVNLGFTRDQIEKQLIQHYCPLCNEQHNWQKSTTPSIPRPIVPPILAGTLFRSIGKLDTYPPVAIPKPSFPTLRGIRPLGLYRDKK
jgi:hypothetical protein